MDLLLEIPFRHFLSMIEENGFEILPISFEHTLILSNLEFLHRDPFNINHSLTFPEISVNKLTALCIDPTPGKIMLNFPFPSLTLHFDGFCMIHCMRL